MGRINRELAKSIAMELPDVEVGSHHGTMDIRVRNRIMATFPKGTTDMILRVEGGNKTYSLEEIDRKTLDTLILAAWTFNAPDALRKIYEAKKGFNA